ncbi:N-acyl-D-amino-acid deacylase family protein [Nocardia sp. CA-128927]|uniref:N-acyl-D-amino-acid deacylase family protein n=1 Tax=Nocardia sp. CA-128927 TaxID=3239975 RepID=UPI003D95F8B9
MNWDLLVRGGTVIDGTGRPGYRADIGIATGRVAAAGSLNGARAGIEIDATGRYVVPGFIDTHVHGDASVWDPAVQLAALRQGVTTFVLGQDGLSFAPTSPAALTWVSRYFSAVNGPWSTPATQCSQSTGTQARNGRSGPQLSVAELLSLYHHTTALNTVYLLPHGTIRLCVMGNSPNAPDAQQLAAMVRLAEEGLDDGAAGVSSGLSYLPARYAAVDELAAVCRPAARRGLPYVTHMRTYGAASASGMAEACAIARQAEIAVHISHYHGPSTLLTELVDNALSAGIDLTYDTYPYLRGCSILARMLPDWLATADLDRTLDILTERKTRLRLAEEIESGTWQQVTLAHVPSARYGWTIGMRLCDAARHLGRAPADFCADLLIDTALGAGVVFDHPDSEDSISELLRHRVHMGGSDGIYVAGHPHPRGYGTFARLLRRHVRELGDWSWEQAVVHLSARPAQRFHLPDRGTIACGQVADLAIIDPATVGDRATYTDPNVLASGIDDVIVAGTPVLTAGKLTGRLPGIPLQIC